MAKSPKEKGTQQPPRWNRDEWIIAVDFYRAHGGRIPDKSSAEIKALSQQLLQVRNFTDAVPPETRNPAGVYLQLQALATLAGDKGLGKAPSRLAQTIWEMEAEALTGHAAAIRQGLDEDNLAGAPFGAVYAQEGQYISRLHWQRERSSKIVNHKKKAFYREHGALFCQLCAFNYRDKYGERGEGFIECHHIMPLSMLAEARTTGLEDLLLVCANCHRVIHRHRPWLTPDEMRGILR